MALEGIYFSSPRLQKQYHAGTNDCMMCYALILRNVSSILQRLQFTDTASTKCFSPIADSWQAKNLFLLSVSLNTSLTSSF